MFDRSAPYRHGVKLAIQPEVHRIEYRFVLPSPKASAFSAIGRVDGSGINGF